MINPTPSQLTFIIPPWTNTRSYLTLVLWAFLGLISTGLFNVHVKLMLGSTGGKTHQHMKNRDRTTYLGLLIYPGSIEVLEPAYNTSSLSLEEVQWKCINTKSKYQWKERLHSLLIVQTCSGKCLPSVWHPTANIIHRFFTICIHSNR